MNYLTVARSQQLSYWVLCSGCHKTEMELLLRLWFSEVRVLFQAHWLLTEFTSLWC